MKWIICCLIMSALTSGAAHAEQKPVYLKCETVSYKDTGAVEFEFTLDEQKGTVTIAEKSTEMPRILPAFFWADKVKWVDKVNEDTGLAWTIDRSTLAFVAKFTVGGKKGEMTGTCSIPDISSRKF